MEPDRFDDVESRILEEDPEPPDPRSRLRRRVAVVMAASLIAGGSMAAAASALTGGGDEPASAAPKVTRDAEGWMRYAPTGGHRPCRRGEHGAKPSSAPRY